MRTKKSSWRRSLERAPARFALLASLASLTTCTQLLGLSSPELTTDDGGIPPESCPAGTVPCGRVCVSTDDDPMHCGGCSRACGSANATAVACERGTCVLTCAEGFDDCDRDHTNGCEASLTSSEHCRRCFHDCLGGRCSKVAQADLACEPVPLAANARVDVASMGSLVQPGPTSSTLVPVEDGGPAGSADAAGFDYVEIVDDEIVFRGNYSRWFGWRPPHDLRCIAEYGSGVNRITSAPDGGFWIHRLNGVVSIPRDVSCDAGLDAAALVYEPDAAGSTYLASIQSAATRLLMIESRYPTVRLLIHDGAAGTTKEIAKLDNVYYEAGFLDRDGRVLAASRPVSGGRTALHVFGADCPDAGVCGARVELPAVEWVRDITADERFVYVAGDGVEGESYLFVLDAQSLAPRRTYALNGYTSSDSLGVSPFAIYWNVSGTIFRIVK